MNFFERQQRAHGTSLRLVLLFALAVLSIVAVVDAVAWYVTRQSPATVQLQWLVVATLFTLAVIGGGTATKLIALRGGGAVVAQSVGAEPIDLTTRDPRLRRVVNVVEEMSIASGVPMPRLFVMPNEDGINAFAAGYTPADAAIAVTAGALDRLNRDELQGVIGHEFSHVLNGDMRLNVRLLGLLNGILLLGLVGLRFLQFGGGRSRNEKGNPLALVAVVLIVLGFVGQFFAGLIKAAVSRQREWLADASAVQFTRQTTGLAGALRKIAGLPEGSTLRDAHAEKQINHMLFGAGRPQSLAATHPPLTERIAALEPGVTPAQLEQQLADLQRQYAVQPPDGAAEDVALGLASGPPPPVPPLTTPHPARLTPSDVSARVGTLTPDDLARGARLSSRIPAEVRLLAGQSGTAVPLLLALVLDRRVELRTRQLDHVAARLGPSAANATVGCVELVAGLDPLLALPLAGLAVPALAARPVAEQQAVLTTLRDLALVDGRVVVFEYALMRVVATYLADAARQPSPRRRQTAAAVDSATQALLAVLAAVGHDDAGSAERAYLAAAAHVNASGVVAAFAPPPDPWATLDAAWPVLDALPPPEKQRLVEALLVAVLADGVLRPTEAELLRTACAVLHCPLPPLVA